MEGGMEPLTLYLAPYIPKCPCVYLLSVPKRNLLLLKPSNCIRRKEKLPNNLEFYFILASSYSYLTQVLHLKWR